MPSAIYPPLPVATIGEGKVEYGSQFDLDLGRSQEPAPPLAFTDDLDRYIGVFEQRAALTLDPHNVGWHMRRATFDADG
ncbi:MAG TPA: hypothetical protein VFM14_15965 [Gemmatimonadales bacterium]|nr:hypothetical protein [Gemmatimonadales bacterium]